MRSLPQYFYRSYLGLKSASSRSPDRLADLLEGAINLAPHTESAGAYRRELAGVLGLSPQDGTKLLTRAEVSAAAQKAAAMGESALLDPLVGTLELKDNRTTLIAVGVLRAFAKDARHRPYLIDKANTSVGRTRERLKYILSS